MQDGIFEATSDEVRAAIYRLRYDIYVEEMNRYRAIADHERRWLVEPDDETGRLYAAYRDGRLVGTMRLSWGGDAPFTERHVDQYDMARFLAEMPAELCIVGERFMVAPDFRGTNLLFRLFCTYLGFVKEKRIQLIFGDCEPHLLNLYQGLGFRTYTRNNVNSPETGYLIPLLMVPEDLDYMRAIGSPLTSVLQDFGDGARVPKALADILAAGSGVISQRLKGREDYWADVQGALTLLEHGTISLFDGLDEETAQHCIDKSNIIACRRGDHLIKKGNVAQNMYVVLDGTLEVRQGEQVIAVQSAGDILGEMAFLLGRPRTADVYAATDDVRVLSLSESNLRKIIEANPEIAARLLLNLSKMLCFKLLKSK